VPRGRIRMTKITRELLSKTTLTPRETMVMEMFADGLGAIDVFESGKVKALQGRQQAVSRQQIHNIKNRALGKMRRRGLIAPD